MSGKWFKVCGASLPVLFARLWAGTSAGLRRNRSMARTEEAAAQAAWRTHPVSLAPGVHPPIPLLTAQSVVRHRELRRLSPRGLALTLGREAQYGRMPMEHGPAGHWVRI